MINILDLNMEQLKLCLKQKGEKEFRAKQIFNWIYNGIWNFNDMNNIPKSVRSMLLKDFYIEIPEIVQVYESKESASKKFLLKFSDGSIIECVVMNYNYGNSICVSTQVGCRMGCRFCASTVGGMIRNLSSGEILSEILVAEKYINEKISNVVLMGSGEPLDNYDNVVKFLETVNAEYGLNIGLRHITLSTCGIVPKIYSLADKKLQITLAVSLHAPSDTERKKIMPVANKYSIAELIEACNYYIKATNKRITFEYALVKDVNDNAENANELGMLLKDMLCHVNLIPVNQTRENSFVKPSLKSIQEFSNILTKFKIENTIRKEMGSDINAACGQLRRDYIKRVEEEKHNYGGDVI